MITYEQCTMCGGERGLVLYPSPQIPFDWYPSGLVDVPSGKTYRFAVYRCPFSDGWHTMLAKRVA